MIFQHFYNIKNNLQKKIEQIFPTFGSWRSSANWSREAISASTADAGLTRPLRSSCARGTLARITSSSWTA
jgi:hypothetical protein